MILTMIGSAATGATTAWLANKIVHAEMWGHIKKHCAEIAKCERRLDVHSSRMSMLEQKVAVLEAAAQRYERDCDRERER